MSKKIITEDRPPPHPSRCRRQILDLHPHTCTKVNCEDCGKKKDTRTRTCLERLPNFLIVHLKRFKMDYSTMKSVKLNDRCSFPMVLDVKPYTAKGIDERWLDDDAKLLLP